jgi:hypothetical protein
MKTASLSRKLTARSQLLKNKQTKKKQKKKQDATRNKNSARFYHKILEIHNKKKQRKTILLYFQYRIFDKHSLINLDDSRFFYFLGIFPENPLLLST